MVGVNPTLSIGIIGIKELYAHRPVPNPQYSMSTEAKIPKGMTSHLYSSIGEGSRNGSAIKTMATASKSTARRRMNSVIFPPI